MDAIAITGIGCKLPGGVNSTDDLWARLLAGTDLITETPADRWNIKAHFHPSRGVPGRTYSYWGGYVADPAAFDAAFFGLTPREAAHMDPQQRWLLETAWEALEDAGIPPQQLAGSRTGVYVGISSTDYGDLQKRSRYEVDMHTTSGSAMSIAANRISYLLDLRGPSLSVDTACSSSLVALDVACQAMWRGEVVAALVGGANAILQPDVTVSFSKGGFLSPTGRCRSFDAAADGFVRAEGAAVVVLKPLSRALADRDRIYALILATLTNQDGRTSGLTVPSFEQQQAMLEEVYKRAGVSASQVGFVEAHGTGTAIGDPIETAAIGKTLGHGHSEVSPLWIGSVKSNLGHLEPAAGIVGLIKLALALRNRTIPPNLHFRTPNPRIAFSEFHLRVPTTATPWNTIRQDEALYGGVNSFGFGGTNAHAVLCSAPVEPAEPADAPLPHISIATPVVWTVSARSSAALVEAAKNDADFIASCGEDAFPDVAASIRSRRSHHPERIAVVADNAEATEKKLRAFAAGSPTPGRFFKGHASVQSPLIAFVFSGQGTQWPGMARDLFETNSRFRRTCEQLDEIMAPAWGRRLVDEIRRGDETIYQADIGQPVLFALQIGLYDLYWHWGIRPAILLGHSFGEVAAAYACGALDLNGAAKVIVERAKALELTRGAGIMAAVGISETEAEPLLARFDGRLSIAAFNSPTDLTLAGDEEAIHAAAREVQKQGRFARVLQLPYAFHSKAVERCREVFMCAVAGLPAHMPHTTFVAGISGTEMIDEIPDESYWWRNLRQPVQFAAATRRSLELGAKVFLEIGPHPGLVRYVRQVGDSQDAKRAPNRAKHEETLVLGSLRRNEPGSGCLAESIAMLHAFGVTVDWKTYEPGSGRHVSFPKYPWQRQRYWSESLESRHIRLTAPTHPLLGVRDSSEAGRWESCISLDQFPYLGDHGLRNRAVFPAVAHIELMTAAASNGSFAEPIALEDVSFDRIVWIDQPNLLHTTFDRSTSRITVSSRVIGAEDSGREVCSRAKRRPPDPSRVADATHTVLQRPADAIRVLPENLYSRFECGGNHYGPLFRTLRQIWTKDGEAWAEVSLDPALHAEAEQYYFHPALFDGVFQAALELVPIDDEREYLFVPIRVEKIEWFRRAGVEVVCHIRNVQVQDLRWFADIDICSLDGECVATLAGCCCVKKPQETRLSYSATQVYQEKWTSVPMPAPSGRAPREWLVVDRANVAGELVSLLRANSERVVHQTGDGNDLLSDFLQRPAADRGIIVFPGLPLGALATPTTENIITALEPLLRTVQGIGASFDVKLRLWLITTNATLGHQKSPSLPNLLHNPIAAMLRTVVTEFPNITCRLIDVEGVAAGEGAHGDVRHPHPALRATFSQREKDLVFNELLSDSTQDEVAYRDGERLANQLATVNLETIPRRQMCAGQSVNFNYTLRSIEPGNVDGLAWVRVDSTPLAPHEIAIEVRAVGLNFRDVLKTLDLYPLVRSETRSLGDECAGIVCGVGSAVAEFQIGDEVVALASHAFGNRIQTPAVLAARKPKNLTFEQAATIPVAFLTADYCLTDIARLSAGESVLIHAAAGGVGQAAAQIAKSIGAEIYATASLEKHDFLRSQGICRIFNSRDLSFAAHIRRHVGERGLDVVLNSLSGEFLSRTLELLAPDGRFVEIGKRDISQSSALNMSFFRQGAAFISVDLASVVTRKPLWIGNRLRDLMKRFEIGELLPLETTTFTADAVIDGFRHMAQGKHRGKLVVSMDRGAAPAILADNKSLVRSDASYLITGGLSGLGLRTAEWLVEQGAKWLVLAARGGLKSDDAGRSLAQLRERGVQLEIVSCDVTDSKAVHRLIHAGDSKRPPLAGVVHSAMVLHDERLSRVTRESLTNVLSPKVDGAWNLHCATRDLPLDWFVMYSSAATIFGSAWQASYVAANRYLDALAWYRKTEGLPAISVNFGPVGEVGVVADNDSLTRYLESFGLGLIPPVEVFQFLKFLLARDAINVAVVRVDWEKFREHNSTAQRVHRFTSVLQKRTLAHAEDGSAAVLQELLQLAPDARHKFVLNHLRRELAVVLRMDESAIDASAELMTIGVDSLMAFEFKLRIDKSFKLELAMDRISAGITLTELANILLRQLAATVGAVREAPARQRAAEIDDRPFFAESIKNGRSQTAPTEELAERRFLRVLTSSEARPLLENLRFDAAALIYVPERVSTVGGYSGDAVATMFGTEPFVSHLYGTSLGRIGLITIPVRATELFHSKRVAGLIHEAGNRAQRHGAKCISLTGLIPSATDHGRLVPAWLRSDTPRVTTGHATTTAAVILNLEQFLISSGRHLASEHLSVLGLGSIGQSCLSLLLDLLPHPASLTLCDVFAKRDELTRISRRLRDRSRYRGRIRVLTSEGGVPDGVYDATIILAAVSVPDVIDIGRLQSGTILVDDSYPPSFPLERAIHRLEADHDILFGNAGMLRLLEPIHETVFLTAGTEKAVERFGIESFKRELVREPNELTACVLSSLLTDRYEGFGATIGLTDAAEALRHYRALKRLGITAARAQCGTYFLDDDVLRRFREKFTTPPAVRRASYD